VILDRAVLWTGSRHDIPGGGYGGLEALYQHVVAGRRAA